MLNCRQISRLVSQSMDSKLSWPQRLAVRLHLLYCVWCRRYAAQVKFLRKATREMAAEAMDISGPKLSAEARTQMHKRLLAASENHPPSSQ